VVIVTGASQTARLRVKQRHSLQVVGEGDGTDPGLRAGEPA
jgi:hypothetical protein